MSETLIMVGAWVGFVGFVRTFVLQNQITALQKQLSELTTSRIHRVAK